MAKFLSRRLVCNPSIKFNIKCWKIFTVFALSYILVYFHRMAPAIISVELMVTFGATASTIGSLSAMYYYTSAIMQIPAGIMVDTFGIRTVAILGNFIAGLGSIIFGLSPTLELAYIGRFLLGLGVSVIFVCFMKSNSIWFNERRYGAISGLALLIGNFGSVLAASPLAYALEYYSWHSIFVVIGVFSLVLSFISIFVLQNRTDEDNLAMQRNSIKKNTTQETQNWWKSLVLVLSNRTIWPSFIINFGMLGGLYTFIGLWASPFLQDKYKLHQSDAALYITISLTGLAIGALLTGWISDRIMLRKPVLLVATAVYCITWLVILFVPWIPGSTGLLVFGFIGISGGGFILTYPCATEVLPTKLAGLVISVVNTGVFIGASILQPAFGYILDLSWEGEIREGVRIYPPSAYDAALFMILGFAILALIATFYIKETRCQNISFD